MDNSIKLNVINSQKLESGLMPYICFDQLGGVIGCNEQVDWHLRDRHKKIKGEHCRIFWLDDQFCLEDLCDGVYINGASSVIGKNQFASLGENDKFFVGDYQIQVKIGGEELQHSGPQKLADMFDSEGFEEIGAAVLTMPPEPAPDLAIDDPMAALELLSQRGSKFGHSLMPEVQSTKETTGLIPDQTNQDRHALTVQADSEYSESSAISLKTNHVTDTNAMDNKELELLESELQSSYQPNHDNNETDNGHISAGPLFRGLGAQVGNLQNSHEMQSVAVDMGAALKAAINGLLSLHQDVNDSRFALINKNLQPIEDNPLRLGLDYAETVKTLFDHNRSPVHLSSAAAIEESLQSVSHHNEAVNWAIGEALNYILSAFSPVTLLKRFKQYRKPSEAALDSGDNWAWSMYENYYRELTSSRQQGFEKLFWEVFDQAYDAKLRELQRGL